MTYFQKLKQILYPIASRYFSRALLVEGSLRGSEEPFRCLFIDNSMFTESLLARMYAEPPSVLNKWIIWTPALRKLILKKADSIDMCVAVLPKKYESTFKGLYDFKSSESVHQIIDTSGSWEDVRNRFCKTKRQIAKNFPSKYGLWYRVSNELKDFDFFYHRMHVPHLLKQFGNLSDIDSYDDMKEFFLKGFLLLVTRGGKEVAGALCRIEDSTLIFRRTGVLDGDKAHVKTGTQRAIYFFQLMYANEQNLRAVDTMMSLPFLNDGVYMNKREWGATVLSDDKSRNWVYFFNTGPAKKIALFFEENPAIIYSDEGLKGVIGIPEGTDTLAASVNNLTHRYCAKGIHGFTILTPEGEISVKT